MPSIEDPGDTFFPYNAIRVIELRIADLVAPDLNFQRRRVHVGDPDQTVATVPVDAQVSNREIGRVGPSTTEYTIYIQSLIIDSDIERGLRTHSFFAKKLRDVLAWDRLLHVALGQLTSVMGPVTESTTEVRIGGQLFHNVEDDGNMYWLSTADLTIITEQRSS
ncbi:hypothetical protein BH766_gp21 [Gordonia phage Demosthenes]|nr:hypothetical protein BH766_gp21 [Gordonia phage Demosthenes]ANA85991.1 hypothetical protein PBI_DEMOSTHENES_21 [Gordonia phage Demosthenes]